MLALIPLQADARGGFGSSVRPLPAPLRTELRDGYWRAGCPVPLSGLRLLTVTTWGFDNVPHTGQLVVNRDYAVPLEGVFRRLYELRWPIRHMFSHADQPTRPVMWISGPSIRPHAK